MGVFGLGVAMIKEEALNHLKPAFCGYGGAKMQYNTPNYPGLWALDGALDYFEEIGWDVIYTQVEELSRYLMKGLKELKIDVLTPENARAGIVSFQHENGAKIEKQMAQKALME